MPRHNLEDGTEEGQDVLEAKELHWKYNIDLCKGCSRKLKGTRLRNTPFLERKVFMVDSEYRNFDLHISSDDFQHPPYMDTYGVQCDNCHTVLSDQDD